MSENEQIRKPLMLKIELSHTRDGLEVRSSTPLMGEAQALVNLPPPQPVSPFATADELRALGRLLYDALLVDEVRTALKAVRNQAHAQQTQLALQLRFDPNAVDEAQRPWELLHDGLQFLLLSGVDLTRYLTFPQAVVPVTVEPPLRVLLVAASPCDLPRLNVQAAQASLAQISDLHMDLLEPPTYRSLLRKLVPAQRPTHVFDFEGHGGIRQGQGGLCFEDETKRSNFVKADALGVALSGSRVALAVINACHGADVEGSTVFTGVAPALILAGVPAVIGMQGHISDEAAVDFFEALYEGISHCLPVTTAVAHARKFLYQGGEWFKPVLYLRSTDEQGKTLVGCTAGPPPPFPPGPPFTVTLPDGTQITITSGKEIVILLPDETRCTIIQEQVSPTKLLEAMQSGFGVNDFRLLCFKLGVDMANLAGEVLSNKMMSLIEWHQKRGIYAQLVEVVLQERPHLYRQLCGE